MRVHLTNELVLFHHVTEESRGLKKRESQTRTAAGKSVSPPASSSRTAQRQVHAKRALLQVSFALLCVAVLCCAFVVVVVVVSTFM